MSNLDADIRAEFAKHNSVFKTARKLGIDNVGYVADVVKNMTVEEKPDLSTCEFDGYGDPDKRKYLVARGLAKNVWDNDIPEIADARKKHEEGMHTIATGRDGPWVLLYLFPQAVKTPRPNYFAPTVEG